MSNNPEKVSAISGILDIAPPPELGSKMRFQGLLVPAALDGPTKPFGCDETGMLLSLVSMVDGSIKAFGTAFLLGPGLAMTSVHVIADYEREGRLGKGPLLLIGEYDGELRAWSASRVVQPTDGDVALIELIPRFVPKAEFVINHVELSARLPDIGEPVLALGLIAQASEFPFDPSNGEGGAIAIEGLLATGVVEEFYPRRDRSLPGPTLRCNFKAPGGMSGGPVFDKTGRVIGILSASMEIEGEWVSWVSLHWHAIMFEVQPSWPQGLYKCPGTLWPSHVSENWHLGIGADRTIAYFP